MQETEELDSDLLKNHGCKELMNAILKMTSGIEAIALYGYKWTAPAERDKTHVTHCCVNNAGHAINGLHSHN